MKRILRFIRSNGVWNSLLIIFNHLEGWYFDVKFRTDTCKRVPLSSLNIDSISKDFGTKYDPSRVSALRRLLRKIDIQSPVNFVDFGSGKGRVLLVASDFKFNCIIGVEFSRELCLIACDNIKRYQAIRQNANTIQVFNVDAIEYKIKDDDSVFFFFNPFGAEVLRSVVENIIESYKKCERRICLIYYNPIHSDVLDKFKSISLTHSFCSFGRHFNIYSIKS